MITSTIHVLVITPVIFYIMKALTLRKGTLMKSAMTLEAAGRKQPMRRRETRLFIATFLVGVAFDFVWEVGQSPLFAPMGGWFLGTWRCFVASLADGVIVLAIAAAGSLLFRRFDWFVRPGLTGYAFMGAVGAALAVGIEVGALATGRWSYADRMPLIPVVQVGLAPVLQMLVLPPLVFAAVARCGRTLASEWKVFRRQHGQCELSSRRYRR